MGERVSKDSIGDFATHLHSLFQSHDYMKKKGAEALGGIRLTHLFFPKCLVLRG